MLKNIKLVLLLYTLKSVLNKQDSGVAIGIVETEFTKDKINDIVDEVTEHWKGGFQYLKKYIWVVNADDEEVDSSITFRVNKDHKRNPSRNDSDHNFSLVEGEGRDTYFETNKGVNIQEFFSYKPSTEEFRHSVKEFLKHVLEYYRYN